MTKTSNTTWQRFREGIESLCLNINFRSWKRNLFLEVIVMIMSLGGRWTEIQLVKNKPKWKCFVCATQPLAWKGLMVMTNDDDRDDLEKIRFWGENCTYAYLVPYLAFGSFEPTLSPYAKMRNHTPRACFVRLWQLSRRKDSWFYGRVYLVRGSLSTGFIPMFRLFQASKSFFQDPSCP